MSNLTYAQRKKHLNEFTGFPNLEVYNIQMPYVENKADHSLKTYKPYYLSKIKGICGLNRKITLSEVVQHVITYPDVSKNLPLSKIKGKVKHTIEYLEDCGFLRFLPDTNGELTFCNYKYYEDIINE